VEKLLRDMTPDFFKPESRVVPHRHSGSILSRNPESYPIVIPAVF
jgi:hypothetical protein